MTATTTLPVLLGTGVHGSRPAANAVGAGALYACSTHGLIYQTDGVSTWSTWATLGSGSLSDQGVVSYLDFTTAGAPGSPAAGKVRLYSKTGDHLAQKDSAGAETLLDATGGGGGTNLGAGSLVGTPRAYATFTGGSAFTLGSTPTAGNILLLFASSNSGHITAISQTNVAWSRAAFAKATNGNVEDCEIWIGVVSASASTSVTVTMSANNAQGCMVQEWSGLSTIDGRQSHPFYLNNEFYSNDVCLAWPSVGGRTFFWAAIATGGAMTVPSNFTAASGAPYTYGGSNSNWLGTLDANAANGGAGVSAVSAHLEPSTTDNCIGVLLHLIP